MNRTILKLVLLVSCAHAMAHVYELSLPTVERDLAISYVGEDAQQGKEFIGWLSFCWRLPWGVGALLVGWFVDRLGAPRMLTIYLVGCALMCGLVGLQVDVTALFFVMFGMGSLASIYHPAGLTLISQCTTPENRARALGLHGVLGSAGIALAPLAAGLLFYAGISWPVYYLILVIPGLILGYCFFRWRDHIQQVVDQARPESQSTDTEGRACEINEAAWTSFFVLTLLAALQGMVYSGFLTFLRRYLGIQSTESQDATAVLDLSHILMAMVLLCGCIGQYLAGRIARSKLLEIQLTLICLGNVPFLIWMATATGPMRIVSASLFSIVHFMNQPIYNSLIAKYTPDERRSTCYGFSFMMGFGVGGLGAPLAGMLPTESTTYLVFSLISFLAAMLGSLLWWLNCRPRS